MSLRNFVDYTLTPPFAADLSELRDPGNHHRRVIVSAEAVWWRCHRRIIADYLLTAGEHVWHILGTGQADEAKLTPSAVFRDDGTLIYPLEAPAPAGRSL